MWWGGCGVNMRDKMDSFGDYKNKIFKKKNPFYQIVMKTKDGNSITISFPSLSSSG